MPRAEIEESSDLYQTQAYVFEQAHAASLATVEAGSYQLLDPNPSHLSPAQVSEEIRLVQVALLRISLPGRRMLNLTTEFRDFPPSVTQPGGSASTTCRIPRPCSCSRRRVPSRMKTPLPRRLGLT